MALLRLELLLTRLPHLFVGSDQVQQFLARLQVVGAVQCNQLVSVLFEGLARGGNLTTILGGSRPIFGLHNSLGQYFPFPSKALITGKAQACIGFELQEKALLATLITLGHDILLTFSRTVVKTNVRLCRMIFAFRY
jgi:hypothetical protein